MSFLDKYREYCTEFTDSPAIFHHRIGLSLISSVMGRRVYMWQGYKKVFPNIWLLIVAPSSFYRKSYSLGIAEDILREVAIKTQEKYILPREFSHEKFVEILSEQPQGLLISYEFKTFMAMMNREYMAGTQSMIVELFDCPMVYDRKIKSQSCEIREPFLNILSATTMDWFKASIKDIDLTSGFLPRFLIAPYTGKKENPIAWQKVNDIGKKDWLIGTLVEMSKLVGPCKISADAKQYYETWYIKFEGMWGKPSLLSPFYARIQEYAKKLAILLCVDDSMSLNIELPHMRSACNLADTFTREITGIVEDDLVYTDRSQKKVIDALKFAGDDGISREDLIRKTRLLADRQLNPIISTFTESNQVTVRQVKVTTLQGKEIVKTVYVWVNGAHKSGQN